MNKYRDKSDFEINKAVFRAARIKHKWFRFLPHGVVTYNIKGDWVIFDPCNNPSDSMPIINKYGISLMYQDREFQVATNDGNYYCCMSNPLKAAMVIFLMMKDAENEKS